MSTQREDFLADVLHTALSGDTQTWAVVKAYDNPRVGYDETQALIEDKVFPGEEEEYEVDIETIRSGISRILHSRDGHVFPASLSHRLRKANQRNDAGEIDAELADVILQVGLFWEVQYG